MRTRATVPKTKRDSEIRSMDHRVLPPADSSSITLLHVNDVLNGDCSHAHYIGNVRFRRLVQSQSSAYTSAAYRSSQNAIVHHVYHEICHERQGRFLVEQPRTKGVICSWRSVGKEDALRMIQQTLEAPRKITILPRASSATRSSTAPLHLWQLDQAPRELREDAPVLPVQRHDTESLWTVPISNHSTDCPWHANTPPLLASRDHSTRTMRRLLDPASHGHDQRDESRGPPRPIAPPDESDPMSLEATRNN